MFTIKESLIAGAGRGVFAETQIRQNKVILKYKGKEMNQREYSIAYPEDNPKYVLEIKRGLKSVFIDAKNEEDSSFAHLINDVRNSSKVPNVQFTTKGYVKTIKKIFPGEELLIDYGKSYLWDN